MSASIARLEMSYSILSKTITVTCKPSTGESPLFHDSREWFHEQYQGENITIEKVVYDGYHWFTGLMSIPYDDSTTSKIGSHGIELVNKVPRGVRKLLSAFMASLISSVDNYSIISGGVEGVTARIKFTCAIDIEALRMEPTPETRDSIINPLYLKMARLENELDRNTESGWGNRDRIITDMMLVQEEINKLEGDK